MISQIDLDSDSDFRSQRLHEQDTAGARSRNDSRREGGVSGLLERVEQLTKQLESLTDQVEELIPRNSSLPLSTEHPHAKPKRKRPPAKKRKQGGQNGHKRHFRELIPSEQCAAVTPCHPDACRRCSGQLQPDGSAPRRHQVWYLPPIEPVAGSQLFEPTSNTAERVLRQEVIYCARIFGAQSSNGSRYLERILTVSETCRLQNRNAYESLIEAMRARFSNQPAPSLLPASPVA